MTCEEFERRLEDEDCRAARLGDPVPADVAGHLAACPACRLEWSEAVAEAQAFRDALVAPLPPALRRTLHAIPSRSRRPPGAIDLHLASLAVGLGATAAALLEGSCAAPLAWQIAAFVLVASWGYALGLARGEGVGLGFKRTLQAMRIAAGRFP
jgi:hypothetical protein